MGMGFGAYLLQFNRGLTITGMGRDVSWGFYIAQFTFLVGVAASAVMLVIPYYLHDFKKFSKIVILGEFLAVSAVIMCVLFIMAERNPYADAIGEYLWKTAEFGFKESEVLVIHTDEAGEITKKDLDLARQVAPDIDKPESKIKAIVSVMMLREGWDVKNVSVVLGLRPFTATAEILPEQVIGRGLRLMTGVGPDRIQTLEVLGTRKLLEVLKVLTGPDKVDR